MAPGLTVRVVIDGTPVDGEAAGLDEGGALLVRDAAGRVHRIRSGDVDVIRVIAPPPAAGEPAPGPC
jgi:biotin-(acetyl-CoA carboxylase) ligase